MTAPDADALHAERVKLDEGFPRKRISAGAAIFDGDGALLIVEPTYREHWLLPGGICEPGESPLQTVQREVREELGIGVIVERVACIDYLSPCDGFSEAVHFLFECVPLDAARVAAIRPDSSEIASFGFHAPTQWGALLAPAIVRRLDAVRMHGSVYCQDGQAWAALGGESRLRMTWPAG